MRVLPVVSHPGPPFVNTSKVREQLGDPEQDKEGWGRGASRVREGTTRSHSPKASQPALRLCFQPLSDTPVPWEGGRTDGGQEQGVHEADP